MKCNCANSRKAISRGSTWRILHLTTKEIIYSYTNKIVKCVSVHATTYILYISATVMCRSRRCCHSQVMSFLVQVASFLKLPSYKSCQVNLQSLFVHNFNYSVQNLYDNTSLALPRNLRKDPICFSYFCDSDSFQTTKQNSFIFQASL